jgi:hypothetical protein
MSTTKAFQLIEGKQMGIVKVEVEAICFRNKMCWEFIESL